VVGPRGNESTRIEGLTIHHRSWTRATVQNWQGEPDLGDARGASAPDDFGGRHGAQQRHTVGLEEALPRERPLASNATDPKIEGGSGREWPRSSHNVGRPHKWERIPRKLEWS
jgi:hypothetical protein